MSTEITYSISEYNDHYTDIVVAVDPESLEVYTFGQIGAGLPEPIWNGKHPVVTRVPVGTVADSLESWLKGREADIRALANGEDAEGLNLEPSEGALASYWHAGDWLAPAMTAEEVAENVRLAGGLDQWVEDEIAEAKASGVYLQADDLRNEAEAMIKEAAANEEEE